MADFKGKNVLKRVENPARRRVTFSKRRKGLIKKASELSSLCGADVALLIFSETGKFFQFSNVRMEDNLTRYKVQRKKYINQGCEMNIIIPEEYSSSFRLREMHEKIKRLQKKEKNLVGEDIDVLSLKQLERLYNQLVIAKEKFHRYKYKLVSQRLEELRKQVKSIQSENKRLKKQLACDDESSTRPLIDQLKEYVGKLHEEENTPVDTYPDLNLAL